MPNPSIPNLRLRHQHLTGTPFKTPTAAVSWFGAVQAQEYGPAKWALALRLPARTREHDLNRAFDEGLVLRTHVLRPTWHFVTPDDICWMLEVSAPHVHRAMTPNRQRLNLDGATLNRATAVIEEAIGAGNLTRAELRTRLAAKRLVFSAEQMLQVMLYAELEAVVCSGPRRNNQFTYALASMRAPQAKRLSRDEAIGELARRFFQSHAPATTRDFMWWSGLRSADAKRGIEVIGARPLTIDSLTYWSLHAKPPSRLHAAPTLLLPIYDEFVVAYRDRVAVPHAPSVAGKPWAAMVFRHTVLIDGQIAGTWLTEKDDKRTVVRILPLRKLSAAERQRLEAEVKRYGRFLGQQISTVVG